MFFDECVVVFKVLIVLTTEHKMFFDESVLVFKVLIVEKAQVTLGFHRIRQCFSTFYACATLRK